MLGCEGHDGRIRWRPGDRLERLFERRCDDLDRLGRGDALAVDGPAARLTYAELDGRANQLARFLARRHGLREGERIGLLFDRAASGYVGTLAVLKLGAAFVPLDASFPADRLAYIAADAGLRMVLSESAAAESAAHLDPGIPVLRLDELEREIRAESEERLTDRRTSGPDDLCYVIYTSGTTGRPKGVRVGHASICNFVRVAAEVYGLRMDDRVYQGLTIAFDFSFEEIWVAWMVGATLVPKPGAAKLIGPELSEFFREHRVTALCCVPSLLATIDEPLPDLRFLLVSGEPCPDDLVERWHRADLRFLNTYGPTEATVSATWTVLDPSRRVTIGVPLPTYSVVVLDPESDRALPRGARGEIGIAGPGLADGYLNRPDLTERSFIPDFLSIPGNPGGRIYRTGDLGRINSDGELEHLGRIDTQVKIRGYRIELEEIEAVMRQVPGVAQAVAAVHEPEPGARELVGYYRGSRAVEAVRLHEHLRGALPAYMIPAYLEPLREVPLTAGGKVDRNGLPPPRGPRQLSAAAHAAPETDLEAALAAQLARVLRTDRVSVEGHFFDELGANSLLMAGFAARLNDAGLPRVSIRDVYLNPTIRRLAAAVDGRDRRGEGTAALESDGPRLPEPIGTPRHRLCGALQALAFLAYAGLAAFGLGICASDLAGVRGALDFYLRLAGFGTALLLFTGLLPVAAKWLLIGRFEPQRIRVWSLPYVRFWVVKTLLISNPVAHLLVGTPLYPLYLRALGAKVGRNALILTRHLPVCTDLLSIGAHSVIRKEVSLNGYRARAGLIEIGPVSIGERAFVGEATVLDIGTAVEDGAEIAHSSSLQAGQRVPAGRCWHGSPAEPAPSGRRYQTVPTDAGPGRRKVVYGAARALFLLGVVGPIEVLLSSFLLAPGLDGLRPALEPVLAAAAVLAGLLAGLLASVAIPRLLSPALPAGELFPVYGVRYGIQRLVARASNNPLLTGLFGDSSAIPHYLRLLGWRLGVLDQTGSNFGLDVKQEVPTLSEVGTGTMVSDGLSMMNAEFSSSSFRVVPVTIGERNFLGNGIHFPAGARTGDNCLLATKVMIPTSGARRSDVGLLGSPSFEIPRSVQRDGKFDHLAERGERQRRLAAKTRHNALTMALHLLQGYVLLLGVLLIGAALPGSSGISGWALGLAEIGLCLAFAIALLILTERAATGFRRLQPRFCSIYQRDFWRHERFWKLSATAHLRIFDGTPFKPLVWRLLGVRIGRRVFDDGLAIIERTLVSIGDESTFNMGAGLQAHSLEDGTFKSERIVVGARCSVGPGALVNYGVTMGDGATLDADSFLMKGSRIPPGRRWRGNPATEVAA